MIYKRVVVDSIDSEHVRACKQQSIFTNNFIKKNDLQEKARIHMIMGVPIQTLKACFGRIYIFFKQNEVTCIFKNQFCSNNVLVFS